MFTRQQQIEAGQKLEAELRKHTMSWDNQLREWYPIAKQALEHTSNFKLKVPQKLFIQLLQTEKQGISMNIIPVLCNNIEERSAHEMGMSLDQWADFLIVNDAIAEDWEQIAGPIRKKIEREIELTAGMPDKKIIQQ